MLIILTKNIRLNPTTNLYEVVEACIKFEFNGIMMEDLDNYLKERPKFLIADWYRSLDDLKKESVKKSFAYPLTNP